MLDNLASYLNSNLNRNLHYSSNQTKSEELFSAFSIANILQKYNKKNEWSAKSLVAYRSTPNLAEISDSSSCKESKNALYKNKSTECLANATDHLENFLFNAYQKSSIIEDFQDYSNENESFGQQYMLSEKLENIYQFLNSENTHVVTVKKDSRGLGFSISGGRDPSKADLSSQLIRISKLYPLQPAIASGNLFVGDIILEVNGVNMVGLTNTEALELLRSSETDVTFKLFRPNIHEFPSLSLCKDFWPIALSSSFTKHSYHKKTSEMGKSNLEEFEVTLLKHGGVLGFTLCKHEESNRELKGFYVHNLIREPAISDGRIHPGDFISKVNDICISSLTHEEAILLLRNCPEMVTLTLLRPDPPVSPLSLESETPIGKPLRWEALELLNDRLKQKESGDTLLAKKKLKRKCNTLSSENYFWNDNYDAQVSCFSDNKDVDEEEFDFSADNCAKDFEVPESDIMNDAYFLDLPSDEKNSEIQTFEVVLKKGWHTRLGFSLCDPSDDTSSGELLPMCAEVKAVYPGSLAAKDGRIQVKDRLLEVNSESLLCVPAMQVVDIIRRKTGRIRMLFSRVVCDT